MLRRAAAEAIGTFFLVLVGCGAIVVNDLTSALGHVGICLAFGLIILVMVLATGHVSGAHLNPAVTLSFLSLRRITVRDAGIYIVAQVVGATAAAASLAGLFPESVTLGSTEPWISASQALGAETLATFMLMFVIVSVATDSRAVGQLASLAIGASVAIGALWAGPISGASLNPARSLGPALISGNWTDHWVYWLGPIGGALLGAWTYEFLREPSSSHR